LNINLHIERLILDGLPVKSSQGVLVQAGVEAELARLLAARTLSVNGDALPIVHGTVLQLNPQISPRELGKQIGRSVYAGIYQATESLTVQRR
jgi:hypothetical protein